MSKNNFSNWKNIGGKTGYYWESARKIYWINTGKYSESKVKVVMLIMMFFLLIYGKVPRKDQESPVELPGKFLESTVIVP